MQWKRKAAYPELVRENGATAVLWNFIGFAIASSTNHFVQNHILQYEIEK